VTGIEPALPAWEIEPTEYVSDLRTDVLAREVVPKFVELR